MFITACLLGVFMLPRAATEKPVNLLLMMNDQHRWDVMSAINKAAQTPNLDALAADGVRFEKGYTSTPTCTPARSVLLTGLGPWNNGMLGYGRIADHYLEEFPRELKDGHSKYWTHSVGKDHFGWNKTANQGIPHGYLTTDLYDGLEEKTEFDNYDMWFNNSLPGVNPMCTGLTYNDYRGRAYGLPIEYHPTAWVGRQTINWLHQYIQYYKSNGNNSKPFMLKVSFHRPHSPYDPPQVWADKFNEKDMPVPWVGTWAKRFAPHAKDPQPGIWNGDMGTPVAQHSRKYYYANVAFIDNYIGQIVDTLKTAGLWDNTFTIFTADHGDMLMDHYHWRKGYPYEGAAHIPFIARWPKSLDSKVSIPRGSVNTNSVVELRDVRATFLDIAHQHPVGKIDGSSLLHLLNNSNTWREWLELEHDICYNETNHWNALTDGRMKYIYNAFYSVGTCDDGGYCAEQLFDLVNDPHEINDLSGVPKYHPALLLWRGRMIQMFEKQGRGHTWVKNGKLVRRVKGQLYSPNYPGRRALVGNVVDEERVGGGPKNTCPKHPWP